MTRMRRSNRSPCSCFNVPHNNTHKSVMILFRYAKHGHCIGTITCQRGGKPDIWDSSHFQLPRSANTAESIPWTSKWVILGIIPRFVNKRRNARDKLRGYLTAMGRTTYKRRLQKCGIPDRDVNPRSWIGHYITLLSSI